MSTEPKDLLQVCMKDLGPNPPTIQEFSQAFCSRCLQKECSRSIAGQSLFEARVANWEERLFKNPEKLSQDDPRFAKIVAQKFVDYQPSSSLPIIGQPPAPSSGWVDPRDLSDGSPEPKKEPTPPRKVAEPKPEPESVPDPSPESVESVPDPSPGSAAEEPAQPKEPTPQPEKARPQPQLPVNTPTQSGIMVGGAAPQAPRKDEWDSPVAPAIEQGATVLKPGGKFRFGK